MSMIDKIVNSIGKWLAFAVLDFIFLVELHSLGLGDRELIYWLISLPGCWGISWIVDRLDDKH